MKKINLARIFVATLGVVTGIVILESIPVIYVMLVFALIGGPLILLFALFVILLCVYVLVVPFGIGYLLYRHSRFFSAIIVSTIGLIILIVIGTYLLKKDISDIRARNSYQNLISNQGESYNAQYPVMDNSNTKIYNNKKYGFEFNYPADWIADESDGYPTIVAFHPKGSVDGAGVKLYYVKSFANFGTVKSLPELLQAVKGTYNTQPNLTFTSTATGGFDAVIVSGLPGYVDNEEEAYVLLDNGVLNIYPGSFLGFVRKPQKP